MMCTQLRCTCVHMLIFTANTDKYNQRSATKVQGGKLDPPVLPTIVSRVISGQRGLK